MNSSREDLLEEACETGRRLIEDNARHSRETLYNKLGDLFPEIDDELLEVAVISVLP